MYGEFFIIEIKFSTHDSLGIDVKKIVRAILKMGGAYFVKDKSLRNFEKTRRLIIEVTFSSIKRHQLAFHENFNLKIGLFGVDLPQNR